MAAAEKYSSTFKSGIWVSRSSAKCYSSSQSSVVGLGEDAINKERTLERAELCAGIGGGVGTTGVLAGMLLGSSLGIFH